MTVGVEAGTDGVREGRLATAGFAALPAAEPVRFDAKESLACFMGSEAFEDLEGGMMDKVR